MQQYRDGADFCCGTAHAPVLLARLIYDRCCSARCLNRIPALGENPSLFRVCRGAAEHALVIKGAAAHD
jgi:hypothetical protein